MGRQHEVGAFATSYIPTDDTAGGKTRNPDNVSMTGDNLFSWFNAEEGTVYAHTKINGVRIPSYERLWSFTNETNVNLDGYGFYVSASSLTDGRYGISGSINSADPPITSIYSTGSIVTSLPFTVFNNPEVRSCFGFKLGDNSNVAIDGFLPSPSGTTITDFPVVDRFLIGQPQRFQRHSFMTVSQLTYYPRRLTDDQLVSLTK